MNQSQLFTRLTDPDWQLAYRWLCQQRRHFPANSDVWDFRFNHKENLQRLTGDLKQRSFRFSPLEKVVNAKGETLHLWSSPDAVVLKRLSRILPPVLGLRRRCTHIKGHGGLKQTVAQVQRQIRQYRFVLRTDVRHYYQSIDHESLIAQLESKVDDEYVMALLRQYLRRTVTWGGLYKTITQGIGRGCPLCPIIAAFHLNALDEDLDQAATKQGLYYVRYMDDLLILSPTRWKLRRAIATVKHHMENLKLDLHPDKSFMGRIEKGFDFLGYHFSKHPIGIATSTLIHFRQTWHRLYEQQQKQTQPLKRAALDAYVTRWLRWVKAGLSELETSGLIRQATAALPTGQAHEAAA